MSRAKGNQARSNMELPLKKQNISVIPFLILVLQSTEAKPNDEVAHGAHRVVFRKLKPQTADPSNGPAELARRVREI